MINLYQAHRKKSNIFVLENEVDPYEDTTKMTLRAISSGTRSNARGRGGWPQHIMVDSITINSILRDKSHFLSTTHILDKMITTITGTISFSQHVNDASIQLLNGIVLHLKDAIWAPTATQNLLSFQNIYKNGFKIAT